MADGRVVYFGDRRTKNQVKKSEVASNRNDVTRETLVVQCHLRTVEGQS